jgi:hypothetical protein
MMTARAGLKIFVEMRTITALQGFLTKKFHVSISFLPAFFTAAMGRVS